MYKVVAYFHGSPQWATEFKSVSKAIAEQEYLTRHETRPGWTYRFERVAA